MKVSGVVTAVLVTVGVALGFLVGKSSGGGGEKKGGAAGSSASAENEGKSGRFSAGSGSRAGAKDRKGGRSPAATIRRVAQELEFSPMAQMDFDIMFGTYESIRWMTPQDIEVALDELDGMAGGGQGKMILTMMLINLWSKQDGRSAVEFAMASKNSMVKSMAMMGGLMGWVKSDPEGAYAWFEENRDTVKKGGGMMRGQVSAMMFAALAQRDMAGAFARMDDLNRQEKRSALSMIGMQTMMDGERRNEFIKELDKLGDDKMKEESLTSMVSMWAYQDPEGAISFIDSREWKKETRDQLRQVVASGWANLDAEAAINWRIENLGENENKADVVANSFGNWVTQDEEGASKWLAGQSEDVRTDQVYKQAASSLQWRDNYEDAVSWAGKIQEPETRQSAYGDIYKRWKMSEEKKAQEWLGTLDETTRVAVEEAATTAPASPESLTVPTIEVEP